MLVGNAKGKNDDEILINDDQKKDNKNVGKLAKRQRSLSFTDALKNGFRGRKKENNSLDDEELASSAADENKESRSSRGLVKISAF